MTPHLRILTGSRAGREFRLGGRRVVLGRSPGADIRLDPRHDLAVSGTHAEFREGPSGWEVRDLDSSNGTFLNGRRVVGATPLAAGDVLRFGADGPEARFVPPEVAGARPPTVRTARPPDPSSPGPVTREVLARTREAVRRARIGAWILVGVFAFGTSLVLFLALGDRAEWEEERTRLLAVVDSLLAEDGRLADARPEPGGDRLAELSEALERSRAEAREIRAELARIEEGDGTAHQEISALRGQLEEVRQALGRQQLAAGLDFPGIEDRNRPAIVLLYVEGQDGQVVTGTGFAVGDDAAILTVRHLLEGPAGNQRPGRVGIQFADSDQVFPGRVEAVSDRADLALLRAENLGGTVPTVRGVREAPEPLIPGEPVAAVGFPLGGSPVPTESGGTPSPARPLVSAGVVRTVEPSRVEIQGFGEAGSSGSPVFGADGEVVAVVYGGLADRAGGILVAVPASEVTAFLAEQGISIPPSRP